MFLSSVPPQIRRLSVVVALLLVAYFVARSVLVPATFGDRGHYRAAAVDSIEKLPIHYAGREACAMCHPQVVARKAASYHRGVACEVCHGPAVGHTTDPMGQKPPAPRDRSFCPSCHAYNPARPTDIGFSRPALEINGTMTAAKPASANSFASAGPLRPIASTA